MNELDSLLANVVEQPEDDSRLLAYAGELERTGDAATAASIRDHVSNNPIPPAEQPAGLSHHERSVWTARREQAQRQRRQMVASLKIVNVLRKPSNSGYPVAKR